MKFFFYPRLAWSGIRKNGKLYLPYFLTCCGMVMMFYIMVFLAEGEALAQVKGGNIMQEILGLGVQVLGIFSGIFLFYTNSFLIRRRQKEFGLYNILGMGKGNLARLVLWETLILAVLSLLCGLGAGVLFSKIAELFMINLLFGDVTFTLRISLSSLFLTVKVFAGIFFLIALRSLWKIRVSRPVELLGSESVGEKPPRANYLYALAGAIMLICAYYLAAVSQNPLEAIPVFFAAVVLVILATYLLFMSGSVALCRFLQKRKRYYYRTDHFVSVSSMVYRMKRNGAGLASICILCTMVLVMLSATMSLYIGAEDTLRNRYPRNLVFQAQDLEPFEKEQLDPLYRAVDEVLAEHSQEKRDIQNYTLGDMNGCFLNEGELMTENPAESGETSFLDFAEVWQVFLVSLEDYNALCNAQENLKEGEVLLYATKRGYPWNFIRLPELGEFQVAKVLDRFVGNGVDAMQILPTLYIVLPDFESGMKVLSGKTLENGASLATYFWNYGFDLDADQDTQVEIYLQIRERVRSLAEEGRVRLTQCESAAWERESFYSLYGGLFFLGVLLGIVFLFAAVLIIYYKQISEGYEDQRRFEIMQSIGMTKREIRKSINSQILTVFFLPLVTAGLHLSFASLIISRLLKLFALDHPWLEILVTLGCFLVFGLFYVTVYWLTSRSYFQIVSGGKEAGPVRGRRL